MLSAAYEGIKARVPEAAVVMGGMQSPHETAWLERVFATPGADAVHKFDVANVHLRGTVEAVVSRYAEFRRRLAGYGFSGPLWVTEHGYAADPAFQADPAHRGGDASQAAYLTQSLIGLGEAGAEQVFVTLRDNLGGEYASEGLVHIDETPGYPVTRRASFAAVRRLVDRWDELMAWRAEQRVQEQSEQAPPRAARAGSGGARSPAGSSVPRGRCGTTYDAAGAESEPRRWWPRPERRSAGARPTRSSSARSRGWRPDRPTCEPRSPGP